MERFENCANSIEKKKVPNSVESLVREFVPEPLGAVQDCYIGRVYLRGTVVLLREPKVQLQSADVGEYYFHS